MYVLLAGELMSNVSRREREREQRRNDITVAAEKLFFSKGYDDVSMNDIAKEAELSKATLYLYFDNKEALFFFIVLRGIIILNEIIKREIIKFEKGIEKLGAFLNAYFEFAQNYPDYLKIYNYSQSGRFDLENILTNEYMKKIISQSKGVVNIPSDFSNLDISYANEVMKLQNEMFLTIYESVKRGMADGTVQSDVDPTEIAVLVILITENILNMRPDLKNALKKQSIHQKKFVVDTIDLLNQMLGNIKKSQ
jgi:TetR/AcrR family transcriptional regulator